jgi:YVTN family beta-propeller protein
LPTKTDEGPGATNFESQLTGLSPNTTYHYRGYATNAAGTFYGDEHTFTSGDEPISNSKDYEGGVLVSGQGSSAGTGSVSFVSKYMSFSEQFIFKNTNNSELGTYLQSLAFSSTNAYISVDNQNTITVVDRYSFKEVAKITEELETPRYMTVVGDKGYSTNWGSTLVDTDDFVAVIDLNSNAVVHKIPVALGPERIVENDGKLYVSHKGAWSTNNLVSVIDIETKNVAEVTVGDNPDELFFDANGILHVLSEGRTIYDENWAVSGHTLASIAKIDVVSNTVLSTIEFAEEAHPSLLEISGDDLYYYLNNNIYSLKTSATSLPTEAFAETGAISGMAINDINLFTVTASYTALSDLNVYQLSDKTMVKTFKVGIGASKIYFN